MLPRRIKYVTDITANGLIVYKIRDANDIQTRRVQRKR